MLHGVESVHPDRRLRRVLEQTVQLEVARLEGWLAVVARSGSSQTWLSTIAEGTPAWYSSDESEEKPSSPISSS